jgi:hypothetical protein
MTDMGSEYDFQIEGNDIDVVGVVQRIQARIRDRREKAEAQGLDYDSYTGGLYPLPPNATLGRDVYYALRRVQMACDKVNVDMMLTETRLPMIGGLVHRVRRVFHELVLFYVERLAARQTRFNQQTSSALTAIVREMEVEARRSRMQTAEPKGATSKPSSSRSGQSMPRR